MKDYYSILQVRRFAGVAEIRRAYRILVQKYHPDVNPDPSAAAMIREINEAYEILGNPEKKIEYDNRLSNTHRQQTSSSPVRPHRDPRYRRSKTGSAPSTHYTQAELMQQYLPYMLWLCRAGILFVVILFGDKGLPPRTEVDEITGIYKIYRRNHQVYIYDLVETRSGMRIKMYDHGATYFYERDKIKIDRTPILRIATKVYREDGGSEIFVAIIYKTLVFVPVFLLLTSVLGILFKKKVGFSFSLTIVSGVLLIINLYLM